MVHDVDHIGRRATAGCLGFLAGYLLLWLLVAGAWRPLEPLDGTLARQLPARLAPHPLAVDVLRVVSDVGSPGTFRVLGVLLAGALLVTGHRRAALWVGVAAAGSGLLDGAAKQLADRPRPALELPLAHVSGLGFPSGHALGSAVGVGLLLLVVLPDLPRRAARVTLALGAVVLLLVGFSRLALGVHYLTDVLGGWLLGAAWVLGTRWLVLRRWTS